MGIAQRQASKRTSKEAEVADDGVPAAPLVLLLRVALHFVNERRLVLVPRLLEAGLNPARPVLWSSLKRKTSQRKAAALAEASQATETIDDVHAEQEVADAAELRAAAVRARRQHATHMSCASIAVQSAFAIEVCQT